MRWRKRKTHDFDHKCEKIDSFIGFSSMLVQEQGNVLQECSSECCKVFFGSFSFWFQLSISPKQISGCNIHFRMLKSWNVASSENLPQMVMGKSTSKSACRGRHYSSRFVRQNGLTIRTRSNIERIFQRSWNGSVVFWSHKQQGVMRFDFFSEVDPVPKREKKR